MSQKGYTKISNEIIEALAKIRIPGEARQVLDVIIRQTWGWNKMEDGISLSQFVIKTGLSKVHICQAIRILQGMNLIRVTRKPLPNTVTKRPKYRMNEKVEAWKSLPKKVTLPNTVKGVTEYGNKSLPNTVKKHPAEPQGAGLCETPIDTITKDTLTKDIKTLRASDKKRLKHGGKIGVSDSVRIEEMKKNPDKSWNRLILRYYNRFGYYPKWAKGHGSTQEFVALDGVLKKLDGDMERLLEYFEIFLNDEDDYLMRNGHRPSLINKLLDGYTRSLAHEKETKYNDVPEHIRIG